MCFFIIVIGVEFEYSSKLVHLGMIVSETMYMSQQSWQVTVKCEVLLKAFDCKGLGICENINKRKRQKKYPPVSSFAN